MLRTNLLLVLLVCVSEIRANLLYRKIIEDDQFPGIPDNANLIDVKQVNATASKRLVCYWGSWSNYRWGVAQFPVEAIDPTLCTHAIYGFAQLVNNQIAAYDTWLDLGDSSPGSGLHGYERFINLTLRNPNLKVMIAIGGWNDDPAKYSAMTSSSATRQTFIQSVLAYFTQYKFNGLDIDWEYPTERGGVPADKQNFISLIRELKAAFTPYGYLLSAAVSPGKSTIDTAYDIPNMCGILDFVNVMAYDYHGSWDDPLVTGFNAPLYYRPGDAIAEFNVNYTVNYFLNGGCPATKLNMGMPLYGRSFSLTDPSSYGVNAPASGGGTAGTFTQEAGYLSYFELCYKRDTEVWTSYWDSTALVPYMVSGNQWVGYDDVTSIGYKANYVVTKGLGGGMVWALDLDDFSNRCGDGNYPLLRTIYTVLNGGAAPTPAPTAAPTPTTTSRPTTTTARPITTTAAATTTRPATTTSRPATTTSRPATTTSGPVTTTRPATTTSRPATTTSGPATTTRPATTTSRPTSSSTTSTTAPTTTRPSTTSTARPSSSTASATTTRPTTTTTSPVFVCKSAGYFRDATNCAKFYWCVANGNTFTQYTYLCNADLVFDPSASVCNYRSVVTC